MNATAVTVLGLGVMGRALAGALLAAGHSTTVWNRTTGRTDGLDGARVAPSVEDAIGASPLVLVCVLDDDAVGAVLADAGHLLDGRTLVNLTNSTPAQARMRAAWARERGAAYLDGGILAVPPMIGGADALVLYSGDRDVFAAHRDTLGALGGARHLGVDPGLAALYDIALLSAMYGMFGGALHAFGLVRTEGIGASEFMGLLGPWLEAMLAGLVDTAEQIDARSWDREVQSPLAMQSAAFVNFVDTARHQGVRDDLIAPIGRLLAEAVSAGHGDHDIGAVVQVLARG